MKHLLLAVVCLCFGWLAGAGAQTTAGLPSQVTYTGLHTACTLSPITTPPSASVCAAGDGVWVSINGGAYVQLGPSVVSGVTSVNGKTGVVVLTGTTTSTTTSATTIQ
jgi:hypothetical protein